MHLGSERFVMLRRLKVDEQVYQISGKGYYYVHRRISVTTICVSSLEKTLSPWSSNCRSKARELKDNGSFLDQGPAYLVHNSEGMFWLADKIEERKDRICL
jgi:hypothetical protein